MKGGKLEAQVGERLILDILDAQRERISAEIAAVSAERDLAEANFRLLAEIGMTHPAALAGQSPQPVVTAEAHEPPRQKPSRQQQGRVFGGLRTAIFD